MGSKNKVAETAQQRAMAEVATQQLADWKQRWLPLQKKVAADITAANEPNSFQRRRASGMATTDTAARFSQAQGGLDAAAANTGTFGGARQKLGITSMGDDQATSSGMGKVRADSSNDDAYIAGLGAITAVGRGEKATAVNGLASSAAISGQQAQADANESLQRQAGWGSLAGSVAGTAWGLKKPNQDPGLLPGGVGAAPY